MIHRRGFTLIELLVVVTIIVALLAILLPSMGQAIEVANRAVCMSNQRQLATGYMHYIDDNFRRLPLNMRTSHNGGRHDYPWTYQLFNYVSESRDVYLCPNHDRFWQFDDSAPDAWDHFEQPQPNEPTTFAMKPDLGSTAFTPVQRQAGDMGAMVYMSTPIVTPSGDSLPVTTLFTQIVSPSGTMLFADRYTLHADERGDFRQMAFVDGHTGWAEEPAIWKGVPVTQSPFFMENWFFHTQNGNPDGRVAHE